MLAKYKPENESGAHTPTISSLGSYTGPVPPISCHPRARYQAIKDTLEPAEITQTSQS